MRVPRPLTAAFFDDIYLAYDRSPFVRELMRSALDDTMPVEVEPYSFVGMDALREITDRLRLKPGELVADLGCGRGGPGMWVARAAGARLVGVDFSAVAIGQAAARRQAFGLADAAEFRVGCLVETGLPDAGVDALMCADSLQFAADPGQVAREAYRVVRPEGRVVFTTWEAREKGDPQAPSAYASLDVGAVLGAAGFTEVDVAERPDWHRRERAVLQRAVNIESGDDRAVSQLRSEASRIIPVMPRVRRVIAGAVKEARR